MTIKLEVGKKYRNRRGEVKGPLVQVSNGCFQFKYARWYPDGKFNLSAIDCPYDLIEEVTEEPVKKPHKHAELIKAWADGAEIEYRVGQRWFGMNGCPRWADVTEYRIKPLEVPQWRKDLAQALEDGKVVEFNYYGVWVTTASTIEEFLNPEIVFDGADCYRIKPEPKPDVVTYLTKTEGKWLEFAGTPSLGLWDTKLKLTFDGETGKLKSAEVIK